MKKKLLKILTRSLAMIIISCNLMACGKESKNTTDTVGMITIAGSTALKPLVEETYKGFKNRYTDLNISIQGGGSGVGINQVLEGSIDIGNSDVLAESKIKERARELVDYKVCGVGFAIVVNKDVKIDSLTKAELQDIFTGKIKNWREVGGENLAINIINRPKSSGTRATFRNTIMDNKDELEGLGTIQDSNGSVKETIKTTEGAISYLALSYLNLDTDNNVKILKINGIVPSKDNIVSKKYPFWSYEHMYTKGEAKGAVKSFIEYVKGEENNHTVEKLGYIPISDLNK
ncbi:phosphate ABC transporter substrate-binding protein [Clostridium rectalis]|uniref:phosphate ABC transporter substrate-binding protein n=1 Tax=Clostridium rectalis TaxID=2040295 RepID=UPI000F63E355|nr:phosphate ABC transporter substrate-binding protein [Clostridium rectalis]